MIQPDYIFNTGEPSILSEIYLPKKSLYQAKLYETLTGGFKIDLEKYYTGSTRNEIKEFLKKYDYVIDAYDTFSSNPQKVFYGYSMYEVDGVFFNYEKDRIDEERTQVIRLIFKPDFENLYSEFKKLFPNSSIEEKDINYCTRHFLRTSYRNRKYDGFDFFERRVKKGTSQEELEGILSLVQRWKDNVGFFLFGYIVFQLTKGVNKIEDEIWVTSNWNFVVNRINKVEVNQKMILK